MTKENAIKVIHSMSMSDLSKQYTKKELLEIAANLNLNFAKSAQKKVIADNLKAYARTYRRTLSFKL